MKKVLLLLVIPFGLIYACKTQKILERTSNFPKVEESPEKLPQKHNFWIFLMAGQSNMAGRGFVESSDTISNQRILTINKDNVWILAKEPIHFYQPKLSGLDCGLEFGKELIKNLDDSIYIGLLPCAVGGSSVTQWLYDSIFNNVQLYSNFKEKLKLGDSLGTVKGILWHQGETDAIKNTVENYEDQLNELFENFRQDAGNKSLPIIVGELGPYNRDEAYRINRDSINSILNRIANANPNTILVTTNDLKPKINDPDHFSANAQRKLGKRYAKQYSKKMNALNDYQSE